MVNIQRRLLLEMKKIVCACVLQNSYCIIVQIQGVALIIVIFLDSAGRRSTNQSVKGK